MEEERQIRGDGEAQLGPKNILLLRHGYGNFVVKADFAESDERRVDKESRQTLRHLGRPGSCCHGMETGGEEETDVLLCQRRQVVPAGRRDAGNKERSDSQASRPAEFIRQLRRGQAIKMNVRIKEFDHQT